VARRCVPEGGGKLPHSEGISAHQNCDRKNDAEAFVQDLKTELKSREKVIYIVLTLPLLSQPFDRYKVAFYLSNSSFIIKRSFWGL
jgi:hypothetical protein